MIRESAFRPAWWLPNGHGQTLYAAYGRYVPASPVRMETFEWPDGDRTRGFWSGIRRREDRGTTVVLLPGLEGGIRSPYIRGLLRRLANDGHQVLVLPFRGSVSNPASGPLPYHAGWTHDLERVVGHLLAHQPERSLALVGFSLGGNMMLRWLATDPRADCIQQAIGVSIPFDLSCTAHQLRHGSGRLYERYLVAGLRRSARRHLRVHGHPVLDVRGLGRLKTFLEFDEHFVAPLHGFRDALDYYRKTSARPLLSRIETPTLILQAMDDPLIPPACLPHESEWGPATVLEWSAHGGHVGFIKGRCPLWGESWLEGRIGQALSGFTARST
jgi:predicted alpha/beta-fold hydrolase